MQWAPLRSPIAACQENRQENADQENADLHYQTEVMQICIFLTKQQSVNGEEPTAIFYTSRNISVISAHSDILCYQLLTV